MPLIDSLTRESPRNPYFWELKAQAYLENGKPRQGLPAITQARALLPNNALLQILHAQILLGAETATSADQAISLLKQARQQEPGQVEIYKFLAQAYGLKNEVALAELSTAEFANATGDTKLAGEKAARAKKYLKQGSPDWYRAADIENASAKK